jgi:hypothetical protein
MGNLQDCVVVKGRHFCWDAESKSMVEVKIEQLPELTAKDDVCEEAFKIIAMRRFGLIAANDE